MIGDIFIGLLLIFSAAINLLAIGSFWVTPSLRTTTNRFVANLLIVNFLSCLVLSPAAFSPAITSSISADSNNSGNFLIDLNNVNTSGVDNTTSSPIESIEKVEHFMDRYQSCALDFVVAVSVLSMLLVVLDTFIAVTDPLRYHSRISNVKTWLLIISCWILGIFVGIASAFQSSSEIITSMDSANKVLVSSGCVYNTMFLLIYFLSIILTPFLFVILMYWRIFTEARESGQRMRQNGSSPLLQSALNLAASAAATSSSTQPQQPQQKLQQQQPNSLSSPHCLLLVTSPSIQSCKQLQQNGLSKHSNSNDNSGRLITSDGLTMNIDKQDYYGVNNNSNQQINLNDNYHQLSFPRGNETKTFLLSSPPHELVPFLQSPSNEPRKSLDSSDSSDDDNTKPSRQHQNILLTLTTACEAATMKRNQSVRQLLSESSFYASHDDAKFLEIRQVRSSPNLQNFYDSTDVDRRKMSQQQQETLELPSSIQASPKALRYMNSLRHRLSNASSLFKYREEGRAARISILGESINNRHDFVTGVDVNHTSVCLNIFELFRNICILSHLVCVDGTWRDQSNLQKCVCTYRIKRLLVFVLKSSRGSTMTKLLSLKIIFHFAARCWFTVIEYNWVVR